VSAPTDAVRLVAADLDVHRPALVELNVAYLTWLEQVCEELFGIRLRDLLGTDVRTYTEGSLDAMVRAAQRHGSFYLVEVDGFVDRDAYEGAEVPKELWPHRRFMELSLRGTTAPPAATRAGPP